jgi:hypothetical protein
LAAYLVIEALFSLTIGTGNQYRAYHMVNALLSGQVFVQGLASLTSPLICGLNGLLAGLLYSVFQRIYARYRVL